MADVARLSLKPVGRSKGKSALAAAAYLSEKKLWDKEAGRYWNYSRKNQVEVQGIIGADCDRQTLWDLAHAADRRKNSLLAREITIMIPREINQLERERVVREFAEALVERYGFGVDFAIHKAKEKDGQLCNAHAHLLVTTRKIERNSDGSIKLGKKVRELDDGQRRKELEKIRELWATTLNRHLSPEQEVSHLSYKRQGLDRTPKKAYLPRTHYELAQKGIITETARRLQSVTDEYQAKNLSPEDLELIADCLGPPERERQPEPPEIQFLSNPPEVVPAVQKPRTKKRQPPKDSGFELD